MSRAANRERSQRHAEFMRTHNIKRTTGMCPMNCGRAIPIGGAALLSHLNFCQGRKK
jgi:hypothetical protein